MGTGLTLGSLFLGLLAWILPAICLAKARRVVSRYWAALSVGSVSACALSICLQIYYCNALVQAQDWAGLEDTTATLVSVVTILIAVTLLLNAAVWVLHSKGKE